ncbi:30S ribosomal protein S6 [Aeoliella mucimassa]|uniref:Small ribosomal subunit protein bS6 n=1 Tax=Aeoliella mucimassa TaxID=2527972 RepID=A0A518ASU1_9BACT|nr:30S ribosomal protein S6 [Aeoliella mucimassa]QDU57767.1 30S ribosomal protein S6 [Aeoliella mucimassa]
MQTQVYEGLFIFDSNRFARDQEALPGEVAEMITSEGGEVLVSRLWEERRLAYPINGQRKGTYWLTYFRSPTSAISVLNRKCEIHDGVLRQLVIKIHPSLVEPILAHAAGVPQEVEEEAEETADEPVAASAE